VRLDQSFVRLPFRVDALRLAEEIATIPESAWRQHPQGAPGNTAVALVAVDGDPGGDATHGVMAPTPFLADLPYVRQVMAALGSTVGRTRLMRIATETELGTHVDVNYYWWYHLRVHVPIETSPEVEFAVEDESVHMGAGEAWVFNTWRNHRVDNPASRPRIHLVIDTVGSAALWDLIERPDREPIEIAFTPDTDPEIPFETTNWPTVMPGSEVDGIIGSLLGDVASVDPDGAARARSALAPFRREWHDLDARFGDDEPGWGARERLVDRTRTEVTAALAGVVLPNKITLVGALNDLVFGPSVTREGVRRMPLKVAGAAPAPSPAPDPVQRMLAGPPRIADPVFIVCPPRSGSSFLFETLTRSPSLYTIGGESHLLIEGINALTPAAHDWESNRLSADDATEGVASFLKDRFVSQLRNRDGRRPNGGPTRLLEKTPKNALRVPFLARAFPDARFVYLYRDPRETVSSMLDAWRSGRFVTYPDLPGWNGSPWSLLLTPGWRDLDGRPLAEVVARQWSSTVDTLLDDLEALDPDRWCVASYDRLVAEPYDEITRLCEFLDIDWDDELAEPLPDSRHTLDSPHPEKWRRNADELEPQLEFMAPAAARARDAFAAPPRVKPVEAGESANRPRPNRRPAPPSAPTAPAPSGPVADSAQPAPAATNALPADQLYASQFTNSFRVLLDQTNSSLVISTYQAGRLIMIRPTPEGLNSHYRALDTPMGVAYDGRHLAVGTKAEVIVFQNQPALTRRLEQPDLHDGCFVARRRHATGDIRIHDLAWAKNELWVVNTRFSCLATLDDEHSFVPRWRPSFVTKLAAEDRCHLNGLTVVDGVPKYVTVLGLTDENNGWRERKAEGGAIIDITNDEIITTGLSMPHSPRWYDGKLWVLQSGIGTLSTVDVETGKVETIAQVPGFARGLTFIGQYALIGLSKVREHVFDGLPLTRDRTDELRCGVWVVDTTDGKIVAQLSFEGLVQEIFEVAVIPGLRYPELVEPGAPLADTAYVLPDAAMADVAT